MKKTGLLIIFFLTILILIRCGNSSGRISGSTSGNSSDTGTAVIIFKVYEHDFGKVVEGEKAGFIFTFKNTGSSDLIITSAITSCGCTVPKYNTNPISPGGSGNIEVVFDTSGRNGVQTKSITIKSNAKIPEVLLKITAEVIPDNNN